MRCFVGFRKSHQRALESLQASLDVEVKARTEAGRLKKKMESDVNELEVQVDQLNKNNAELMKTVKKLQQQIKVRLAFMQENTLMMCVCYMLCVSPAGAPGSAGGGGARAGGAEGGADAAGAPLHSAGH